MVLIKYQKSINEIFSDNLSFELNWVKFFFRFFALWAIVAFIENTFLTNKFYDTDQISLIIYFFQSILLSSLYILASTQRKVHNRADFHDVSNIQIKNQAVNHNLKDKLIETFDEKQFYLKKDLTIWDVCRETNSNRTYISNLINDEFGMNFNHFVNKYRVEQAIYMLKNADYNQKPLDEIARLSGFNSLTSFNRAFKKFTNSYPGSYRKKVEVEIV